MPSWKPTNTRAKFRSVVKPKGQSNTARLHRDFEALRSRLEISDAGRLTLKEQEMILLPRHFFRYILREARAFAGPRAFRKIFAKAGYDGAVTFCRRFREVHGCTPRQAVKGYLKEMSLRGWGRFALARLEPEKGRLQALLRNSALAPERDLPSGHVIWEGSMLGALAFLRECMGKPFERLPRVRSEALPAGGGAGRSWRIVVSPGSR